MFSRRREVNMETLTLESYYIPNIDKLLELVQEEKPRRIIIEAPPGLKYCALRLGEYLERRLNSIVVCTLRFCWGFCDTDVYSLISGKYDLIIHLGHILPPNISKVIRENIPNLREIHVDIDRIILEIEGSKIIGWPVYRKVLSEPLNMIAKIFDKNIPNTILTTQQYLPYAQKLIQIVRKHNTSIYLITGCYIPRVKEDKVLVISSGLFHPITPLLFGHQPDRLIAVDVEKCRDITKECIQRFKHLLLLKLSVLSSDQANIEAGVIVSSKVGQRRLGRAIELHRYLQRYFQRVYMLEVDEISEDVLRQVQVDYYINTACPRIGFDDLDRIKLRIVNIGEVKYLTREKNLGEFNVVDTVCEY